MDKSDEIDEIILYLFKTKIDLDKIKIVENNVDKELTPEDTYHIGVVLDKIKKYYNTEIIKTIPEEKMIKFKNNKKYNKESKYFFIIPFCISLISFITASLMNETYEYLRFFIAIFGMFLAIFTLFGGTNLFVRKELEYKIRHEVFNKKNEFKNKTRKITMNIINKLSDEEKYNGKMKDLANNLKEYLVKENYSLEKDKKNIFNDIKKDIEKNIFGHINNLITSKSIEDKKIIPEIPSNFSNQLNFLISKEREKNN